MIPSTNGFLQQDFEIIEQTSRTYQMDIDRLNIRGITDKQDAMKQAIYKILQTERYQFVIYSWNYGVEFIDLIGEPISFILPEIKRRIEEALLQDTRITGVDNFQFEISKSKVLTTFTAYTIFGDITIEKAVNI
jgi:phage baseplate assembly protein W